MAKRSRGRMTTKPESLILTELLDSRSLHAATTAIKKRRPALSLDEAKGLAMTALSAVMDERVERERCPKPQ
jgi:hypothetical protein